jgi:hypothetical protein
MNSQGNLKGQLRAAHQNVSTSLCEPARRNRSPWSWGRLWRVAGFSIAGLLILLMAAVVLAPRSSSAAQIAISVRVGPPPLPVYDQPLCPGPGYIWTPGYWAYDPDNGYYWVPGTWVVAPEPGFLWTPGYWGWSGGLFLWHGGYWGPHVGFYGGINYGFGYTGVGYEGGYWRGREFFYNRTVNNVNAVNIRNVYNRNVVNNVSVTRVAYNGGPGGITARPAAGEMTAEHERHIAATSLQQQHQNLARQNRAQFASVNHGRPSVTASARPAQFHAQPAERAGGAAARPSKAPAANRNFEREQGRTPSAASRPTYTPAHTQPRQEKAPIRNAERPQGRTAESRPAHSQPSHAAAPNRNASHPPAQERRSNPPEERKPPAHGSEPRH